MTKWDLIIDIGGSNARFAAARDGGLQDVVTANATDFDTELRRYIAQQGGAPQQMGISAAGTKQGDKIALTNVDITLDASKYATLTTQNNCLLLNDFAAAAWFIDAPDARKSDCIYDAPYDGTKPAIMVGVGTGLGVGTYVPGTHPMVLQGEGGHVSISPRDGPEREIFKRIAHLWPDVVIDPDAMLLEAEAILSGIGIPILYDAISGDRCALDAAQVMARAQGADRVAQQVVAIVSWHLGRIVGDFAISVMAQGGIFLTGGVLQKNPALLDQQFISAVQAGGRFGVLRQTCPIYLCTNPQFGLIGVMRALRQGSFNPVCHAQV